MEADELKKELKCLPKSKFGDLFPITSEMVSKIQSPHERPGQAKSEKIQVAPKRFSCSILSKSASASLEKEM